MVSCQNKNGYDTTWAHNGWRLLPQDPNRSELQPPELVSPYDRNHGLAHEHQAVSLCTATEVFVAERHVRQAIERLGPERNRFSARVMVLHSVTVGGTREKIAIAF